MINFSMIIGTETLMALRRRHKTERDGRIKDRIKAVVLYHGEKLSVQAIAQRSYCQILCMGGVRRRLVGHGLSPLSVG